MKTHFNINIQYARLFVKLTNLLTFSFVRFSIFLCIWDDRHRNTNMNNKDHVVGRLTNCRSLELMMTFLTELHGQ